MTDTVSRPRVYRAPRQDKPWGHEVIFAAEDDRYVGKVIHVREGQSLSLQYHQDKEETLSVLAGRALVEYGAPGGPLQQVTLEDGDAIHLPPLTVHRITAVTSMSFVEASTAGPGWRTDVVRLEDRYGREGTSAP